MTLPYENASAGDRALGETQKLLREFGCSKFGTWVDDAAQEITLQFEYRGMTVSFKVSLKGYAQAWLKDNPYTSRMRCTKDEHYSKALGKANLAVYSIMRDYVKAQLTAIHCGILSFEAAFLSSIMLPNGRTIMEQVTETKMLTKSE